MEERNKYNSIQSIALEKIVRRREQTYDNYEYYTQLLRGFARKLNLLTPYGLRVFRAHTDHYKNGQIQLPADYVKYAAVGVVHNGVFTTLTYDSSIFPEAPETCESLDNFNPSINDSGVLFPAYFYGSRYYPAMMSVGGGFNEAYFTEKRSTQQIFVSPKLFHNEIVIYYVSDGQDINDYTLIPAPYFEPALLWIDHKEDEASLTASEGKKDSSKRRFDIAMMEALPPDSDMNYTRFIDTINRNAVKLKIPNPNAG